jgi:hypothetical protein
MPSGRHRNSRARGSRWVVLLFRSTESVQAENLFLRRQLALYIDLRQAPGRFNPCPWRRSLAISDLKPEGEQRIAHTRRARIASAWTLARHLTTFLRSTVARSGRRPSSCESRLSKSTRSAVSVSFPKSRKAARGRSASGREGRLTGATVSSQARQEAALRQWRPRGLPS